MAYDPTPGPREAVLGSGAGGPLSPPTPWLQYTGYLYYPGGIVVGANAAGGNQGNGTVNCVALYATSLYLNGQAFNPASYLLLAGGTLTGPLVLAADPTVTLGAATKHYVDNAITNLSIGNYLLLSGGTMTGPLIQAADPVNPLGSATKQYVDNNDALHLLLAGGTLTGPLILAGPPTVPLGAATKAYADSMVPLAGGTMTGFLVLNASPTTSMQAATKQYVDNALAGLINVPDAPNDGSSYVRLNGTWSTLLDAGTF